MLKIQKISMVALLLGTAVSVQANVKDQSYAVGALLGSDIKSVIDAQKGVITYDESKLLAGVKDALAGKVDLNDPELGKTLQGIDDKLKAEQQKIANEQAKKALSEGEKFAAEFKKKD